MKTVFEFIYGIVLMIVMYFYFVIVSILALLALPFVKLADFVRNYNTAINQPAAI